MPCDSPNQGEMAPVIALHCRPPGVCSVTASFEPAGCSDKFKQAHKWQELFHMKGHV